MDICEVCRRNLADFLCLCSTPFLRVCNVCVGTHVIKPSRTSHSLEPIACRQLLKGPEDVPRYRARQHAVRLADSALDQNFERLEAYKSSLQSLTTTVNTWVAEKLTQLGQVETQMTADITACKEKTVELMRTANPTVGSKLAAVALGPDCADEGKVSRELTLFQGKTIEDTDIRSTLEGLCQMQISPSPHQQSPSAPSPIPLSIQGKKPANASGNDRDSVEALRGRLSQLELVTAKNENKLDEKSERIRALEQEVSKAQAERLKIQGERDKVQVELQQAGQLLITAQRLLEQKGSFPQTPPSPNRTQQEVHPSVRCDGCQQDPLQGPRWNCQSCDNFDFCQRCYDSKPHPTQHQFRRVMP